MNSDIKGLMWVDFDQNFVRAFTTVDVNFSYLATQKVTLSILSTYMLQ